MILNVYKRIMHFYCLSYKTSFEELHFYIFVPLIKDHMSYKTTFCGPMGWS